MTKSIVWERSGLGGLYCKPVALSDGTLVVGSLRNTKYNFDNGGNANINCRGLKYSTDNAVTWNNSNVSGSDWQVLKLSDDTVLAFGSAHNVISSGKRIKYSTDKGVTWQDSTYDGEYASGENSFIAIELPNGRVIAQANDYRNNDTRPYLYSTDRGKTWQSGDIHFKELVFVKDILVGVTSTNIKYSTDYGITWQDSVLPEGKRPWSYTLKVLYNKISCFGTDSSGKNKCILYSTDNGITWQNTYDFPTSGDINDYLLHPSGSIIITQNHTLKYSTNNGLTWLDCTVNVDTGNSNIDTVIKEERSTFIMHPNGTVLSLGYGILYSLDNGVTWELSSGIDTHDRVWFTTILSNGYITASATFNSINGPVGIKYSTDGGITWQDSDLGPKEHIWIVDELPNRLLTARESSYSYSGLGYGKLRSESLLLPSAQKNGKEYLNKHGVLKLIQCIKSTVFKGTSYEWEALSPAEKDKYDLAYLI